MQLDALIGTPPQNQPTTIEISSTFRTFLAQQRDLSEPTGREHGATLSIQNHIVRANQVLIGQNRNLGFDANCPISAAMLNANGVVGSFHTHPYREVYDQYYRFRIANYIYSWIETEHVIGPSVGDWLIFFQALPPAGQVRAHFVVSGPRIYLIVLHHNSRYEGHTGRSDTSRRSDVLAHPNVMGNYDIPAENINDARVLSRFPHEDYSGVPNSRLHEEDNYRVNCEIAQRSHLCWVYRSGIYSWNSLNRLI